MRISKEISPISSVSIDALTAFLIDGDKDDIVQLQQTEAFADGFKKINLTIESVAKKGEGHG